MAKPWFQKFPTMGYDIDGSGEKQFAVNILQRLKMRDILKKTWLIFYEYDVKDTDTPEILAYNLYGNANYYWIVMLANDMVDPVFDWPLTFDQMIETIRATYTTTQRDGLEYAHQTIHHYEDLDGYIIDEYSYNRLPDVERKKVSIYDWHFVENEKKRRIRLLDERFVDEIDKEADSLLKRPLV